MRKLALILATAAALAGAFTQTASATTFVAYGEGLTRCTIEITKDPNYLALHPLYDWGGETSCDRPLEQTGQAFFGGEVGTLCSGVRTTCSSGDVQWRPGRTISTPVEYRVTLRAPLGQGWLGAPTYCSGVGTDNLSCVFKENDTLSSVNRREVFLPF
jgi:hypothetical protein